MPDLIATYSIFDDTISKVLLIQQENSLRLPSTALDPTNEISQTIQSSLHNMIGGISGKELSFLGTYDAEKTLYLVFGGVIPSISPELIKNATWVSIEKMAANKALEKVTIDQVEISRKQINENHYVKNLQKINRSITQGIQYIKERINLIDQNAGWDHYLDVTNRIGVIGTSFGILTMCRSGISSNLDLLNAAADTLVRYQHISGGWGTKSLQDKQYPIVHSSAYGIWALASLNRKFDSDAISKAVNWLIQNHVNGGWGIDISASKQTVTATSLALTALSQPAVEYKNKEEIIKWLKAAQYPNGGWSIYSFGNQPGLEPTPAQTGRALYALMEAGVPASDLSISKGLQYLIDTSVNGRWQDTIESDYTSDSIGRLEFKHSGTQWALMALLRADVGLDHPIVLRGISNIIDEQTDSGFWLTSLSPGHFPIWALSDNIFALLLARQNLSKFTYTNLISQLQEKAELAYQLLKYQLLPQSALETHPKSQPSNNIISEKISETIKNILVFVEQKAEKSIQRRLWLLLGVIILFWVSLIILNQILGWNNIEPWTYIISFGVTIISLLYFAVTKKEVSPRAIYMQMVENKKSQMLEELGIDSEVIQNL